MFETLTTIGLYILGIVLVALCLAVLDRVTPDEYDD